MATYAKEENGLILPYEKYPTKRAGLVQSGPRHHLIENQLIITMI
jgi:hypothetical protein